MTTQESVQPTATLQEKIYIPLPTNVNYAVQCFPTVPYTHPDSPKLDVRTPTSLTDPRFFLDF